MDRNIVESVRSVAQALAEQAQLTPEKVCLEVVGVGSETYGELYQSASRAAARLAKIGVTRGARVVLMLDNGFDAIHISLGLSFLGAVDVSINTAYRGMPFQHAVNLSQAGFIVLEDKYLPVLGECVGNLPYLRAAVFCQGQIAEARDLAMFEGGSSTFILMGYEDIEAEEGCDRPVEIKQFDTTNIIYTSGTTGPAKAVLLPAMNVYFLASQTVHEMQLGSGDIYYCAHPQFHMAGKFMEFFAIILAGGTLVLAKRFDPKDWIRDISAYRATVTLAHGPMIEMIQATPVSDADDKSGLKKVIAVPLPRRIGNMFTARFAVQVVEIWGMTEVGIPCWGRLGHESREGSCGTVRKDWFDFQVVDPLTDAEVPPGVVGEFVVRNKFPWLLMQGYLGMPEETSVAWRNLWFHTGDSGYVDTEGNVFFVDRMGDRIRRRAENISSYDIESAVALNSSVLEVAAIGVPSIYENDDDIKVCVVLKDGAQPDPWGLIEFLADKLPYYCMPRYIQYLEALPRTPTNKVKKRELRELESSHPTWDREKSGISLRKLYGFDDDGKS